MNTGTGGCRGLPFFHARSRPVADIGPLHFVDHPGLVAIEHDAGLTANLHCNRLAAAIVFFLLYFEGERLGPRTVDRRSADNAIVPAPVDRFRIAGAAFAYVAYYVVVHTPVAVREWFDRNFMPQAEPALPASSQVSEAD